MGTATRQRLRPTKGLGSDSLRLPAEELHVLHRSHPNVLLAGPLAATAAALESFRSSFRPPIVTWRAGTPLVLPRGASVRTLVLDDVAALSLTDQRRLLDWLQENKGTAQVIAASSLSLLPLVERDVFLEALYYLLNVIYLEVAR